MSHIGRRDLILLLIDLKPDGTSGDEISGVTRLQKLLFLLEKEEDLRPSGEGFAFQPWKAGPYSSKLYDDLEFLENLGYLQSDRVAVATEAEASEAEAAEGDMTFEALMGGDSTEPIDVGSNAYEERRFCLTPEGAARVREMLSKGELSPVTSGIRKVKSRYSTYSLNDLLYHIYTRYPEMAVASEIKNKVLSRGRR